ncbi:hypothetical protein FRC09_001944 [Ceratobasidium sp. 395]|nr:hypothetical protein FRC09_001944 [Ceratobasidium sp. 395]
MPPKYLDGKIFSSFIRRSSSTIRSTVSQACRAAKPPVPGRAEVETLLSSCISTMKTHGDGDAQSQLLFGRIEGLLSAVQDFDEPQYLELSSIVRQLIEIKEKFKKESKHRWHHGVFGAERRQNLLDNLDFKLNGIVEAALLRQSCQARIETQYNPIGNFPVIPAHEITDQELLYPGENKSPDMRPSRYKGANQNGQLVSTTRYGQFGKLRVIYKTYTSDSDDNAATRAIETDLKCISSCLHPNIVTVVGITKAYFGPNGYVVAIGRLGLSQTLYISVSKTLIFTLFEGGIPITQFMLRVDSGAALITYIRGINSFSHCKDAMRYGFSGCLKSGVLINGFFLSFNITVATNGTPTLLPLLDNQCDAEDSTYLDYCPIVMDVYFRNYLTFSRVQLEDFLDSIRQLDQSAFTESEALHLAVKYHMSPCESKYHWAGAMIPPFTISHDDVGYVASSNPGKSGWEVVEAAQEVDSVNCRIVCNGSGFGTRGWKPKTTRKGQWISVALCECKQIAIVWASEVPASSYDRQAKCAQGAPNESQVEAEEKRHCTALWYASRINRANSSNANGQTLYFHRNPYMRTDPRAYWGFLSPSINPYSPVSKPAEMKRILRYDVYPFLHIQAGSRRTEQLRKHKTTQQPAGSIPVPSGHFSLRGHEREDSIDGSCNSHDVFGDYGEAKDIALLESDCAIYNSTVSYL